MGSCSGKHEMEDKREVECKQPELEGTQQEMEDKQEMGTTQDYTSLEAHIHNDELLNHAQKNTLKYVVGQCKSREGEAHRTLGEKLQSLNLLEKMPTLIKRIL